MSDPPRLLETMSTEAELLEAWSSMPAPANGRAKALALAGLTASMTTTAVGASMAAKSAVGAGAAANGAVGAGAAVAAGTGVAAGAGATVATGAGLLATKWLAAIGVVAVLGGGSVVAAKKMSAPAHVDAPAMTTTVAANEPPRAEVAPSAEKARETAAISADSPPPEPIPFVAAADLPSAEAPARRGHHATTARTAKASKAPTAAEPTPEPAPVASTLGAEVSALDTARNALRSGDPARALRELDAFDAKHPSSALAEDAAFLRFDANVALGDRAGTDKSARTFLARYPSSPRAAKVKRWLDGAN